MTSKKKLIKKLQENPTSLRYSEIIRLFSIDEYTIRQAKGSHILVTNNTSKDFVSVPLHNNDCKNYYKIRLSKLYFNNL